MKKSPRLRDGAIPKRCGRPRFYKHTTANELSSTSRANLVYGVQLSDILSRFQPSDGMKSIPRSPVEAVHIVSLASLSRGSGSSAPPQCNAPRPGRNLLAKNFSRLENNT